MDLLKQTLVHKMEGGGRACPTSMLTFFFLKEMHEKKFALAGTFVFLMKLFFLLRKKKTRKINQGDSGKSCFCVQSFDIVTLLLCPPHSPQSTC